MHIYICGNGNVSFDDFLKFYATSIQYCLEQHLKRAHFLLGDFRGVDTLCMELLKTKTPNVSVYHIGETPRYFPDSYKTKVSAWTLKGGYGSDEERDKAMMEACTHYIAKDFNSNEKRKSGTLKNIEYCEQLGKIRL